MMGRRYRWLRLVIPLAIVATILASSMAAYSAQQPDITDPNYLSPTSGKNIGSKKAITLLTQRKVTIRTMTQTSEALSEAAKTTTQPVTLLITTPALVHPFYLRMIKLLPATVTVVLVAPTSRVLNLGHILATVQTRRLTSRAEEPGCDNTPVSPAGTARVFRYSYKAPYPVTRCYRGAVTTIRRSAAQITLVGADDPFRNDRIDELNNADFVTGLLSQHSVVLWLDLHRAESIPEFIDNPDLARQNPAPPYLGHGSPDPEFPIPSGTFQPTHKEPQKPEGKPDRAMPDSPNPLWEAFPPWIFATVALLILAVILLALARGRRLGGPVPEPLPVIVRATETVEGRGRLYQRAKARHSAITTLRDHALRHIRRIIRLSPDATSETITAEIARSSGWSPQDVWTLLYGPLPQNDRELVTAAVHIEKLMRALTPGMSSPSEVTHDMSTTHKGVSR